MTQSWRRQAKNVEKTCETCMMGTSTVKIGDANDVDRLTQCFETFDATDDRPTMIIVDSHIGWGAPHKQDTASAHGEPLGVDETTPGAARP